MGSIDDTDVKYGRSGAQYGHGVDLASPDVFLRMFGHNNSHDDSCLIGNGCNAFPLDNSAGLNTLEGGLFNVLNPQTGDSSVYGNHHDHTAISYNHDNSQSPYPWQPVHNYSNYNAYQTHFLQHGQSMPTRAPSTDETLRNLIQSHRVSPPKSSEVEDDSSSVATSSDCSQCSAHCSQFTCDTATACTQPNCAQVDAAHGCDGLGKDHFAASCDIATACTQPDCAQVDVAFGAVDEDRTVASILVGLPQEQHNTNDVNLQHGTNRDQSITSPDYMDFDDDTFMNPVFGLNHHLQQYHFDQSMSAFCNEPCPLEDPSTFDPCPFPAGTSFQDNSMAYNMSDLFGNQNSQHGSQECGIRCGSPQEFIQHYGQEHLSYRSDSQGYPQTTTSRGLFTPPNDTLWASDLSIDTANNFKPRDRRLKDPKANGLAPIQTTLVNVTKDAPMCGDESIPTPRSASSASHSEIVLGIEDDTKCFWCDAPGSDKICGVDFQNADELHKHVLEDHVNKMTKANGGFMCLWQQCSRSEDCKSFEQKSKIQRHMQTHTGYKPYSCDICGTKCSAKQALDQHKLIHSGEKPLICDWPGCGKHFRQQSALTMHTRTHTGDKPLHCNICGQYFAESSNLSKHKRTHDVQGKYACAHDGCTKRFNRHDQLRKHVHKIHGVILESPPPATIGKHGKSQAASTAMATSNAKRAIMMSRPKQTIAKV